MGGWLTTVLSHVCLDMLRQRNSRMGREVSWETLGEDRLPASMERQYGHDPEYEAMLAESVGLALLAVMDSMSPDERVAFVLHDVFGVPLVEIAPVLNRTAASVRQLASRARRRVRGAPNTSRADVARQQDLVNAFLAASRAGDLARLLDLLHPDVILRDDRTRVLDRPKEIRGSHAVARQVMLGRAKGAEVALINGSVGVVVAPLGRLRFVVAMTLAENRIIEMDVISHQTGLSQLEIAVIEERHA